ncbi:MAG TPA: hypothetical protein VK932_30200 [Kofleriaceae bacterium]|nr:hypothetical protein [Kofleriaceae bacterium]
MLRLLVYLALAVGIAYCGATVPLGKRTFFGHVKAIWATPEAQELKDGVKESAGPAADRVKRGIEKGVEAATEDEAGSGSAARKPRSAPTSAPASP